MNTSKVRAEWERVSTWYEKRVRPLLSEWDAQRVPAVDAQRERLGKMASALETDLKVCILGRAGVGKSTLLNALLDERQQILPQGGIGPLTAHAIEVQYSEESFFEVRYHGRAKLNRLLFAITQQALLHFGRAAQLAENPIDEDNDEEEQAQLAFDVAAEAGGGDPDAPGTGGSLQQGRLIIQGDQFAKDRDVRYVVDGLRACLGLETVYCSEFAPADLERIEAVNKILPPRSKDRKTMTASAPRRVTKSSTTFAKELKFHAAGFLAPLVADLKVGWPSPILQAGATLVDLPGVGIANDEYRSVTQRQMRQARAVGFVVDDRGIDEASVQMLRNTGFLNALLIESGDEAAEPVHLFVVAVKLDLSAKQMLREAREEGIEKTWMECFEASRRRAMDLIRGQIDRELAKLVHDSGAGTRGDVQAVVTRLRESLVVHAVAPTEFQDIRIGDAHIADPEDSYVPQLGTFLRAAATARRNRLNDAMCAEIIQFKGALDSALNLLRENARNDERVEAEVRALRQEFEAFASPLGKELAARKGAFRSFLRETLPAYIESAVREATDDVRKELQRHIRHYREYPWPTLRATIRRGGAFVGARHVDLPSELTLKFEEPIAIVWSKGILTLIRKRTRELGEDNVRIATSVVDWTRKQGGRVPGRQADLLEEDLRTDTRQLASVGKDAIEELRERVKQALYEKLQERIRKACKTFVDAGNDVGVGVRNRMHEFLENVLADAVLDSARPKAVEVLKGNYSEVQGDIEAAMKKLVDPVERAKELVVDREANRMLNKDRERREALLKAVAEVVSVAP